MSGVNVGAAVKRLRPPRARRSTRLDETADLMRIVLTLLCHGCPIQGIVAAHIAEAVQGRPRDSG